MATNEQIIWQYLKSQGLSDAGAAGLMGNLFAESGLKPTNLQNSYEKKLGYSDDSYTNAVDNGTYDNFVRDSAGYGLAQWTFYTRKQNLLDYAKSKNKSIGDLEMQLAFLIVELSSGYKSLLNTLKTTKSVREASDGVLLQFERPADQSVKIQLKRAEYGQTYYDKFANKENVQVGYSNSSLVDCVVKSPNHSGTRTQKINRITPHCVVGQATAEGIGNCFPKGRQASCNYGIGYDGRVCLIVDEANRSWCSSSNDNDQRAITIECASDTTDPYAFTDACYKKLILLCIDICKRNGLTKMYWFADKNTALNYPLKDGEGLFTVHRWFANKACPGDWLFNRMSSLCAEVNKGLAGETTNTIIPTEEEEEMTQEQFNVMMNNWVAEQAKKEPGDWSAEQRAWAEKNGFIAGDTNGNKMYKKFLTREELITVLYRALHRYIIE